MCVYVFVWGKSKIALNERKKLGDDKWAYGFQCRNSSANSEVDVMSFQCTKKRKKKDM